ncbi:uncharacterized protein LOC130137919 [Syzygium oleosum]|uniref:uncharacterized protein LOC130137919 n=1 Tax=Syzygium oleosum TaxID=219896 RepID=UPI0024BB7318|nr:uncharacterized protein LOC130137919 [Syzygium oleosum]
MEPKIVTSKELNQPNLAFMGQKGGFRGGRNYGRGRSFDNRGCGYGYQGRSQNYRPFSLNQDQEVQRFKPQTNTYSVGPGFLPHADSSQRYQETKSYPTQNSATYKNLQVVKATDGVRVACQICKRPGHDALRCWYRFDNSYQDEAIPQALAAMHLEDPTGSEWYPDTGATTHITANPGQSHQHHSDAWEKSWGALPSGSAGN